ncbi:MAG: EAL domain-containing protein [Desulfovibrionaceae bacterium]
MPHPPLPCRILVADDEDMNLRIFREVLAPEVSTGSRLDDLASELFQTRTAERVQSFDPVLVRQGEDAVEAVRSALEADQPFCLAFLDVRMPPGMDGITAAERIRALDPDIQIVIITAFSDVNPQEIARRVPPADRLLYVQKPFHPQEIRHFASSLGAKWRTQRELDAIRADLERRVEARTRELTAAHEQLAESERLYRTIFETTGTAMTILEADTTISLANGEFERLSGFSRQEVENRMGWTEFVHPDDLARMREFHKQRRLSDAAAPTTYEFRFQPRNGRTLNVLLTVGMIPGTDHSVASLLDITERKQAEERLAHQAFHDELTGLANRALFMDRLARCIRVSQRREDYRFAMLFLDLDRFKVVNDSLGHLAGDAVLQSMAQALAATVRAEDTLARFGGDEFAVLLEDVQDIRNPIHVAERIQEALAVPVRFDEHEVFATASMGIVLSSGDYESPEHVLRDADIAMYRAKGEGGARFKVFSKRMHEHALGMLKLETDLRKAVAAREFEAFFQPVVRVADLAITGFEALARWRHPERGLVSPLEFIPAAEETGLVAAIDQFMLEQACARLAEWRNGPDAPCDLNIAVNFSVSDFTRPDILHIVRRVLAENGLSPRQLRLELTESTLMQSGSAAVETLGALRAEDIRLAIDDFGTGYSSLAYLTSHPIDALKIDRSFVADMEPSAEAREIVRTIVALAHTLGMEVVAEGVETRPQFTLLQELGCDYVQGYLFSPPIPAAEVVALAARGGLCRPRTLEQALKQPQEQGQEG